MSEFEKWLKKRALEIADLVYFGRVGTGSELEELLRDFAREAVEKARKPR